MWLMTSVIDSVGHLFLNGLIDHSLTNHSLLAGLHTK